MPRMGTTSATRAPEIALKQSRTVPGPKSALGLYGQTAVECDSPRFATNYRATSRFPISVPRVHSPPKKQPGVALHNPIPTRDARSLRGTICWGEIQNDDAGCESAQQEYNNQHPKWPI